MGTVSSVPSSGKKQRQPIKKRQSRDSHLIRSELKKEFGKFDEGRRDEEANDNNGNEIQENIDHQSGLNNKVELNLAVFKAKKLFLKPVVNSRPKAENLIIKKQNNGVLLKELYRRMDPSLNKFSTRSVVGELEVAVKYKVSDKFLLVKIGRGKGLSLEEMQYPSPYVSVDLFRKSKPHQVLSQHTRTKISTRNPVFQEILMFSLQEQHIAETMMKVSIWDQGDDIVGDEFLGETVIQLCKVNLSSGNMLWYKLKQQVDLTITGHVEATVDYDTITSTLYVTVHGAEGLKVGDKDGATSHPFYRIYITGLPTKQESKVVNDTLNPEWMETFEFDVHQNEFSRRIVVVNVFSQNPHGGKPISLGDVHIPLVNFVTQDWGNRESFNLQDLRSTPYVRSKWSEDGVSMEFQEALRAHAIYGYPKFLFKEQHQGKKIVSCYSEKARTQAKMVLMNGVPTFEEVEV